MNKMFLCLLGSVVVLSAVGQGCSSDTKTELPVNASPDASDDAIEEADAVAPPDATHDTSAETTVDAGEDVLLDAAHDTSAEADGDAVPDAPDDAVDETSADASDATHDTSPDVTADASDDASSDAPDEVWDDAPEEAGEDAAPDAGFYCPSCEELLTWDTTQYNNSTYGGISTLSTWPDAYAWQMIDECPGWGIYQGHQGGLGDTLEISSCSDGLVLVWAYEHFSSIRLSEGWTGKTDTDFVIGSSYDDFIAAYPDYEGNSMLLTSGGNALLVYVGGTATFENSALTRLNVY